LPVKFLLFKIIFALKLPSFTVLLLSVRCIVLSLIIKFHLLVTSRTMPSVHPEPVFLSPPGNELDTSHSRRTLPREMGVPRLLKLRMASLTCSRPAVALVPAPHPLSSFLLARTPAAAAALPRPASLSFAARSCVGRAAPQPARPRVAAGRRFPGVAAMSSSTPPGPVQKSEEQWEAILTPEQFRILRLKGTE
jgi:hypothetical protein